jgi:hypothetical protein
VASKKSGGRFPVGARNVSLLYNIQTGSGTHPASYTIGAGDCSPPPREKRQGREADHSPPSGVRVQNGEASLPLPHTSLWPRV